MSKIRTRFAPSPTGFLHIGSLRTVLFTYLIAKSQGGDFILRIEDTDQKREVSGAVEGLLSILKWSGIEFDEGPGINEKFGPYIQSQRMDIYKKYQAELLAKDGAYPCFCTAERLDKMRLEQQKAKKAPRYDRFCRNLSQEEIEKKIAAGEKYVIRQKMPLQGEVKVFDELRGEIVFQAEELDDQVLIKTSGMPTYQFANVIDDHLMKITHVSRGDEWLPSFPKNILLYQSFGWAPPKFIHFPVVLNKEGGKLSKRQGDVAVEDFRDKGYLPEAINNFCALLGWSPYSASNEDNEKKNIEILALDEMIKAFEYKKISPSPAVFDIEKLDYFNGYYIRQKKLSEIVDLCLPHLASSGHIKIEAGKFFQAGGNQEIPRRYIEKVVSLEQERLKKISEIGDLTRFFFVESLDFDISLLLWKKLGFPEIKNNLKDIAGLLEKIPEDNWTNNSIEDYLISYIKSRELKVGDYLWPMRVALTGEKASPSPFDIAEVLGKEKSLKRIEAAISRI